MRFPQITILEKYVYNFVTIVQLHLAFFRKVISILAIQSFMFWPYGSWNKDKPEGKLVIHGKSCTKLHLKMNPIYIFFPL